MGTLHREVIKRRKVRGIVLSIIILCMMITVSNFVGQILVIQSNMKAISDGLISIVTIGFLSFEILRCRTRYKYSIIVDKLIIHKIYSEDQKTLENIKISDIVYIDKIGPKSKKFNISSIRIYLCNILSSDTYCCIYKYEEEYRKFYFQPSKELVNKIINSSLKYNKVAG
ncbi:hypothetical protein CPJCM30710_26870 [Clostridium polyendosporum]|uniref:Uncharacterized protein n=1 Tax=Clostridium polyendosporum TaxID=69208 RepID=A0A919S137_9CLOT|nr:hypothetical protein [Clostridium polyendosporum]GIM30021.1 hypothetical protein CPJCM30710_26870 [Clostridium polyendosporum]